MQKPPSPDQPLYNPMMQEALKDLNEFTYISFLIQNKDFVEPSDESIIKKNLVALGIFFNVQIKRIPKINFLNWNKYLRWSLRIPIFFSPHLIVFGKNNIEKFEDIYKYHRKYYSRIRLFQKTGDMRALDPENKLLEQFRDQMKNM